MRLPPGAFALLSVALVDELWSGVAVSGAPSVERELALSHRGYVTLAFALPLVAAALLEGATNLLSDLRGRAPLVVLAQGVLAASLFFTAWTSSAWGLTVGLALAGASSGVACAAGQAMLVVSNREDTDRALVRWSLFCAIGDVLTPLVTASAIALGRSYRGAMAAIAVVVCVQFAVSAAVLRNGAVAGSPPGSDAPPEPLRTALSRAVRLPRLWAWLFAAASCTLLDELVVALAALRLGRDRGAIPALATAAAVAFAVGSVVGARVTDRTVARLSSRRVLVVSALGAALSLAAFLASGSLLASCASLFLLGVACAPHHPLAMAGAYRELPERPGTVQAIGQIFVFVDVAAPLAIGVLADRFGLGVAIACLVVQPAVVLTCAALLGRKREA